MNVEVKIQEKGINVGFPLEMRGETSVGFMCGGACLLVVAVITFN